MRIISAYGNSLSSEAWLVSIRSVIFKLLSSIEGELQQVSEGSTQDKEKENWKDTAIVVIQGISGLFSSYLTLLTSNQKFSAVWQELLDHLATMLDFQILEVNAAAFAAVRDMMVRRSDGEQVRFSKETIDLAWNLWSRGIPVPQISKADQAGDNQKCLLVWVETLLELYRLVQRDLSVERVGRMLTLLREAMQQATPGAYASDVEYVTPLQGRILEVFRMVRTDLPGVPSAMITQVAEFVSLAFTQDSPAAASSTQKRTYVAMSKQSMSILQALIIRNAAEHDIYESGSFAMALSALGKPIILKYSFPVAIKSVPPWRQATMSFLSILEAALPHVRVNNMPRPSYQNIWHMIVTIANGIISADSERAPDSNDVMADQDFDMTSFHKLRELIIPALGAEAIPDKTRKIYAEGLFRTSIVHQPTPAEAAIIYANNVNQGGSDTVGLGALYKPRMGRTIDPWATLRSKMSYACVDELFALVAVHDEDTAAPMILVQPPTPRLPPPQQFPKLGASDATGETARALHIRLARTAAPYLILRCALVLRGYTADQPLRGRMPQPLSQRAEVVRVLRGLVALRSEADAIPDTPSVDSEGRKHLLRLYPLLVSAGHVAGSTGDEKVLGIVREALDVVGGELGV
jgi:hypothetical protein